MKSTNPVRVRHREEAPPRSASTRKAERALNCPRPPAEDPTPDLTPGDLSFVFSTLVSGKLLVPTPFEAPERYCPTFWRHVLRAFGGDKRAARYWLAKPNLIFGGRRPIALALQVKGKPRVLRELKLIARIPEEGSLTDAARIKPKNKMKKGDQIGKCEQFLSCKRNARRLCQDYNLGDVANALVPLLMDLSDPHDRLVVCRPDRRSKAILQTYKDGRILWGSCEAIDFKRNVWRFRGTEVQLCAFFTCLDDGIPTTKFCLNNGVPETLANEVVNFLLRSMQPVRRVRLSELDLSSRVVAALRMADAIDLMVPGFCRRFPPAELRKHRNFNRNTLLELARVLAQFNNNPEIATWLSGVRNWLSRQWEKRSSSCASEQGCRLQWCPPSPAFPWLRLRGLSGETSAG
jgi:Protein of unknown function (DUF2384)